MSSHNPLTLEGQIEKIRVTLINKLNTLYDTNDFDNLTFTSDTNFNYTTKHIYYTISYKRYITMNFSYIYSNGVRIILISYPNFCLDSKKYINIIIESARILVKEAPFELSFLLCSFHRNVWEDPKQSILHDIKPTYEILSKDQVNNIKYYIFPIVNREIIYASNCPS